MVTDEIMEAIEKLIQLCKSEEQRKGMRAVWNMLGDFDENEWAQLGEYSEWAQDAWAEHYLPVEGTA